MFPSSRFAVSPRAFRPRGARASVGGTRTALVPDENLESSDEVHSSRAAYHVSQRRGDARIGDTVATGVLVRSDNFEVFADVASDIADERGELTLFMLVLRSAMAMVM